MNRSSNIGQTEKNMGTLHDMLRKLERMEEEFDHLFGQPVSITPDKNGMIDKQCPKQQCRSFFKVNAQDWKDIVRDEEVFCPFCRNNSTARDYFPQNQKDQLSTNVRSAILRHWHHGTSMVENLDSLTSADEFELQIQCEKCNTRFSVLGATYFCPCCGYTSVEKIAKESIVKSMLKAQKVSIIQSSLEQSLTKDEAAVFTKTMVENALPDCIGTLQAFSESKYKHLSNTNPPFNAFQNVDKSNKLWMTLKGQGYDNWLTVSENRDLLIYTQQRHLIEHKGGIVDSKYLSDTNDVNYQDGDRLIIRPTDIITLGNLVLKIIDAINKL